MPILQPTKLGVYAHPLKSSLILGRNPGCSYLGQCLKQVLVGTP